MEGWIKLYRQLLKSPIFENEKALKIWIWCLLKASHIDREKLVGLQVINIKKGQFIFGRKKASEELNINENTIYKYIKMLEKLKMIDVSSNNKFSIVSIRKWEDYQYLSEEEEQQSNNRITTEEQQSNTNKNVKNNKNIKNKVSKKESMYSFNDLIDSYTSNEDLRIELKNHLAVRKQKKGALTNRAIELSLKALDKLSDNDEVKIKIVQQSIIKGWVGFFEIKGFSNQIKNSESNGNIFEQIGKENGIL